MFIKITPHGAKLTLAFSRTKTADRRSFNKEHVSRKSTKQCAVHRWAQAKKVSISFLLLVCCHFTVQKQIIQCYFVLCFYRYAVLFWIVLSARTHVNTWNTIKWSPAVKTRRWCKLNLAHVICHHFLTYQVEPGRTVFWSKLILACAFLFAIFGLLSSNVTCVLKLGNKYLPFLRNSTSKLSIGSRAKDAWTNKFALAFD